MGKTEILTELARLTQEELTDVRRWLDQRLTAMKPVPASHGLGPGVARLRSPRLADPARAIDFAKQVTELPADAAL